MHRLLTLLIGPESLWILAYLIFRWLGARNIPATEPGNRVLMWAIWIAALVLVPLCFASAFAPGTNRWLLLGRTAVACFIGLNACTFFACDHIHSPGLGQDSGLMALWLIVVMVGAFVWVLAAVATLLLLRWKAAA